jgi:hypothetical protein
VIYILPSASLQDEANAKKKKKRQKSSLNMNYSSESHTTHSAPRDSRQFVPLFRVWSWPLQYLVRNQPEDSYEVAISTVNQPHPLSVWCLHRNSTLILARPHLHASRSMWCWKFQPPTGVTPRVFSHTGVLEGREEQVRESKPHRLCLLFPSPPDWVCGQEGVSLHL